MFEFVRDGCEHNNGVFEGAVKAKGNTMVMATLDGMFYSIIKNEIDIRGY